MATDDDTTGVGLRDFVAHVATLKEADRASGSSVDGFAREYHVRTARVHSCS